ncbi:MarR family winged helix-turn-helix transcriptional regulator [Tsukamurella ocularis]|uniref:MarR family winged helix-turn-helix transcriptional regulator n=1 Tax=Tsukamurella ocularis TaxID=1970234 RepID=UPI00216A8BF3|nr:MarR family transcriptional regulator [Tsukamurella ocularis]MCS3779254.1 DNA-binding MarR family transcriptional regulator [Tsukamurella ocularis]MCS3787126.1 DNA-binding MarR family transcriptional regulator [Tsukamurella ocularis]MCS3852517.1 DNA-binding MarR family transcriptional regulator [Tsukamurella ocularis]
MNSVSDAPGAPSTPPSDAEVDDLAARLRSPLLQLHFLMRRNTPGPDLTPAQQSALQSLLRLGPVRMGELARFLRIRLPSATSAVDGLERLGLAQRTPDPDDGRAVVVQLSEHGEQLTSELIAARNAVLAEHLHELTDEDRRNLDLAVPALNKLIDRYRDDD